MTDSLDGKKMIGGYGSDDKVEMETGDKDNVSAENSNKDQPEASGPADALELGSDTTDDDNLSGGGTSGFGKGS